MIINTLFFLIEKINDKQMIHSYQNRDITLIDKFR